MHKRRKVLIIDWENDAKYAELFPSEDYEVHSLVPISRDLRDYRHTDLVVFEGGADVSPHLYEEENLGKSFCDLARDRYEKLVFEFFEDKVPMIGICRGGQFLNVMNGGKMNQHIPNHRMRTHEVLGLSGLNREDPELWRTTVLGDHHQGIVPPDHSVVIGWSPSDMVPEAVWFPKTRCLAFQAHPEWGHKETYDYFHNLIEELIYEADRPFGSGYQEKVESQQDRSSKEVV